jgi:hypothetical protein
MHCWSTRKQYLGTELNNAVFDGPALFDARLFSVYQRTAMKFYSAHRCSPLFLLSLLSPCPVGRAVMVI